MPCPPRCDRLCVTKLRRGSCTTSPHHRHVLAGCQRLRPPLLCHRQDADVLTAPRLHPRREVTSPSAWRPTPRAPAARTPPPYPPIPPHGAGDTLVRITSSGPRH